eukprot:15334695-Ditylum_brightwellii.AAC.1
MLESIERTNKLEETGKYFFICKKRNATTVTTFLECKLQTLYQEVVPTGQRFEKIPTPRRSNTKAAWAVGTYKSVLQGDGNPQEDINVDVNAGFDHMSTQFAPESNNI